MHIYIEYLLGEYVTIGRIMVPFIISVVTHYGVIELDLRNFLVKHYLEIHIYFINWIGPVDVFSVFDMLE